MPSLTTYLSESIATPTITPTATPTPGVKIPLPPDEANPNRVFMPIPEDPNGFNTYLSHTGYEEVVAALVYGGLVRIAPDGGYYPQLAADIPTTSNGGVSPDGLTVTWHLRSGIRWSDGVGVTSQDILYTWEALQKSGVYAPGFDLIDSITTPNDLTAVVKYRRFYPNYLLQFGGRGSGIFPAHYCGAPDQMLSWECNTKPLSNGPFLLRDWTPGDRLVFERNPRFWQSGRPNVDQVVMPIITDPEIRRGQIQRQEADIDLWLQQNVAQEITTYQERWKVENVRLLTPAAPRVILRLIPNLAAPAGDDPEKPHPILGDIRVRQAIRLAIDTNALSQEAFGGYAVPVTSELFRLGCSVPEAKFDPAAAQALLDQAGWKPAGKSGMRECHGCQGAEEGTPLKLKSYRYAEFGETLADAHRMIADMLGEVGIELDTQEVEGRQLWTDWTDNGLEARGEFDLDLWDDGYNGVEPVQYLVDYYYSRSIPRQNDPYAGFNISRYRNSDLDRLLDQLRTFISPIQRRQDYCQAAEILDRDLPAIPLLALPEIYAISQKLEGVSPSVYDTITWNAADWRLNLPEKK